MGNIKKFSLALGALVLIQLLPAPQLELLPCASAETAKDKVAASGKEELAPVLDPGTFVGLAQMGYAAAKGCPQVIAHIFCYCGCDITDNHKSLLDCFTGLHGVDCHICQEEALQALRQYRNGDSLAVIQQSIDEGYSSKYPFKDPTPALKKYLASRLWHPQGQTASQAPANLGSNPEPNHGSCCAEKDKEKK